MELEVPESQQQKMEDSLGSTKSDQLHLKELMVREESAYRQMDELCNRTKKETENEMQWQMNIQDRIARGF